MAPGALELWARTAAASSAPDGEILFILPAEMLGTILAAFEVRFGAIAVLPFAPRPGAPASRILVRGIKGSRAPLNLLATRSFHSGDGTAFTPEIDAILRGAAPLHW
jgi:tRNA1(Val) A37 N6-methylase TrmN6